VHLTGDHARLDVVTLLTLHRGQTLAQDGDVLIALLELRLELAEALDVDTSLRLDDSVLIRELPVERRFAGHDLLRPAKAIDREAPGPRTLHEEQRDAGDHDHHSQCDDRAAAHAQLA
jgi:hypothetical protein